MLTEFKEKYLLLKTLVLAQTALQLVSAAL